ncbi:hypothetical protein F5B22DRAFT_181566 [Xylaria bambusicola]|uniref:uncharacterized protein n=1 Tax=Xylaria bambusicola TaxID=326684 RepID=UPI002008CF19|nr:uncharacterized protein F5B22DRAFT_181566 [Xylaria bambusicola]KAI0516815.1 hypothetical protein F5B22DRAFT_181566 [Xylaria bambusicola]
MRLALLFFFAIFCRACLCSIPTCAWESGSEKTGICDRSLLIYLSTYYLLNRLPTSLTTYGPLLSPDHHTLFSTPTQPNSLSALSALTLFSTQILYSHSFARLWT